VRVLAVDQAAEEKNGQKVIVGRTATVQLSPEQAETLANARQQGALSLSLRSLMDSPPSILAGDGERKYRNKSINTVRYGVN
jgi:pilus assembly protein CpaB